MLDLYGKDKYELINYSKGMTAVSKRPEAKGEASMWGTKKFNQLLF
jgi:hypothetical protein